MAIRKTRQAGLPKPRVDNQSLRIALDNIIERLEVLDGIRGDNLDRAVTFRDLDTGNFTVKVGSSGSYEIIDVPPAGSGGTPVPGIGPAGPPTGLAAAETYLALLLTWNNPDFNLQHIEVWRSASNNLSTAQLIGTTVSPQYLDYVGANATFYYWARSVGTDGTYSAYHPTGPGGIKGITGVDPGEIILDPDNFKLIDGVEVTNPFLRGTLADDTTAVGLDGTLLIKGSIRAESIVSKTIGVDQLVSNQVSGIFASFGNMRGGRIRTGNAPQFRVEIEDQAATVYPLWYGSGSKGANTGLFWVDRNGNVKIKGLLDASIIKGTLFTPADRSQSFDPFRIATQYTSQYKADSYNGKIAHLLPMKSVNQATQKRLLTAFESGPNGLLSSGWPNYRFDVFNTNAYFLSDYIRFYSPISSKSAQYGRLGTMSEMLMLVFSASGHQSSSASVTIRGTNTLELTLEYRYDSSAWKRLTSLPIYLRDSGSAAFNQVISTRTTSWGTFDMRLRLGVLKAYSALDSVGVDTPASSYMNSLALTAFSPNFGVADTTAQVITGATPVEIETLTTVVDDVTGIGRRPQLN